MVLPPSLSLRHSMGLCSGPHRPNGFHLLHVRCDSRALYRCMLAIEVCIVHHSTFQFHLWQKAGGDYYVFVKKVVMCSCGSKQLTWITELEFTHFDDSSSMQSLQWSQKFSFWCLVHLLHRWSSGGSNPRREQGANAILPKNWENANIDIVCM